MLVRRCPTPELAYHMYILATLSLVSVDNKWVQLQIHMNTASLYKQTHENFVDFGKSVYISAQTSTASC